MCTEFASEMTEVLFFLLQYERIMGLGEKKTKQNNLLERVKGGIPYKWPELVKYLLSIRLSFTTLGVDFYLLPRIRSWHLSNAVPLPVGSGLPSLALTVTAKRTFCSLGVASLGQALFCNL